MTDIREHLLHEFVGKMLGDLGAATSVSLIRIGDKLGIYKALHQHGPCNSQELADHTGLAERYLREWLNAQAASGYLEFHYESQKYEVTPEQAMVFVNEDSPVYLMGGFDLVNSMMDSEDKIIHAFKTGEGVPWSDLGCVFCAAGRFFRPSYVNNLVQTWLPALDGVVDKLNAGAKVADIGCGRGFSTLLMAEAFPNSTFVGYDFHDPSMREAQKHAEEHNIADRLSFHTSTAKDVPHDDFDLVTCFDCLHDMGDPEGAAAHIRSILKPDGTWMIVEPIANDHAPDNFNPVGRIYYNASTMICIPTSLAQEVGAALGAQAGEKKIAEIIKEAGFSSVRRATEGPFNMILEAKP